MKDSLVREIIAKITDWEEDKLTKERKDLQLLSEYKYDEYQKFSPGMRFMESLALWLHQFKDKKEQNTAYDFIKNNLVFISTHELNHIIRTTYPDFIKHILIKEAASELKLKKYLVTRIVNSKKFRSLKRSSLFLGLSDGAHIDLFRRFSGLEHEQIYPTYQITKEKAKELLSELRKDIKEITEENEQRYKFIFLIDDFSASGISYIRKEKERFVGKISKFYEQLKDDKENHVRKIFDMDRLKIFVILYIATEEAKENIQKQINELMKESNINTEIIVIQKITYPQDLGNNENFVNIIKGKIDKKRILTESFKKGSYEKPHLGFNECKLTLVLSHNCPNNSLPIIWHQSKKKNIQSLFPREDRHKE
jgi:hypothetical protein